MFDPGSLGHHGLFPPGAEDVNLLEDLLLVVIALGGGELRLQLEHLPPAMLAAIQLDLAFDHVV